MSLTNFKRTGIYTNVLTVLIAAIWLVNGLVCKVLNLVPRHQQIVARILSEEHAAVLTKIIGGLEILMAIWVLSRIQWKLCITLQVLLVAVMNIIEYNRASDLLLFGRMNILVAAFFILLLIFYALLLEKRKSGTTFKH